MGELTCVDYIRIKNARNYDIGRKNEIMGDKLEGAFREYAKIYVSRQRIGMLIQNGGELHDFYYFEQG